MRGMTTRRKRLAVVLTLVTLPVSNVLANGRFPSAGLLVIDPSDANHVVVRATFGLIDVDISTGSGTWTCEQALGLAIEEDPMLAITASGNLVVATNAGIRTRAQSCDYASLPELNGQVVSDLSLDRGAPHRLLAFTVRGLAGGQFASQLLESNDDGESFSPLGPELPPDLLPLTLDVAPSDSKRVYLSARNSATDGYSSVLLVSHDGGLTFTRTVVPATSSSRLAYIAGVHPLDADRVYLRVNDPESNVLWLSRDGGTTLESRFSARGKLLGFAIAPDGAQIAFGGPSEGVWVGDSDAANLEQRSEFGPGCLTWGDSGLFACGNAATEFLVGRSDDGGRTFSAVLRKAALCEQEFCAAETQLGAACAGAWPPIARQIGAPCEGVGVAGAGGAPTQTGGLGGSPAEAGQDPGPSPSAPRAAGGCTFDARNHAPLGWVWLAASATWIARRLQPGKVASAATRRLRR